MFELKIWTGAPSETNPPRLVHRGSSLESLLEEHHEWLAATHENSFLEVHHEVEGFLFSGRVVYSTGLERYFSSALCWEFLNADGAPIFGLKYDDA